jgi:hypothetical protein
MQEGEQISLADVRRGFDAHITERCAQRGLKKLDYKAFFTNAGKAANMSNTTINVDAFQLGVQKCDTGILQKLDFLQMPFEQQQQETAGRQYSTVCGSVQDCPVTSQKAPHAIHECYVLSIYCY